MRLKRKTKDKRPRRILFVDGRPFYVCFENEGRVHDFMQAVRENVTKPWVGTCQDGSTIIVRPAQVSAILVQRDG